MISELVRFSPGPDLRRTGGGAGSGRGAWLCAGHPVECLDQAIKRHSVARALRAEVSSDDLAGLRAKLVSSNEKHEMFEK